MQSIVIIFQSYNKQDYKEAISFFTHANSFPENSDFSYLSNYWLADCYYQINDFEKAIKIYTDLPVTSNANLSDSWRIGLTLRFIPTSTYVNRANWDCILLRGRPNDAVKNNYVPKPIFKKGEHMYFSGYKNFL